MASTNTILQKLSADNENRFIAHTEATAASQNMLNDKIDDIIDAITLSSGEIAVPFLKGSSVVKISKLGEGLSVSSNTLSASATVPAANKTVLGGIRVAAPFKMVTVDGQSNTLLLDLDDSLTVDSETGKLKIVGGTGGITLTEVNNAIDTKINDLDVAKAGGTGKYIESILETNGKITASAVDFPFSYGTDIKYYSTNQENNYSSLGATITSTDFNTSISLGTAYTFVLLLPPNVTITHIYDLIPTDIKSLFKSGGLTIHDKKFYNVYYYSPGGNVSGTYRVTKT